MPNRSPGDVLARLEAGRADPVYLLLGSDEVGKAPLADALEALVPPDLQAFNLQKFYATDSGFDLGDVIAAARTLPFLGGHRVVTLLRAEAVLKPKKKGAADADQNEEDSDAARETGDEGDEQAARGLAEFAAYLEKPSPEACLVLVAADVHRGSRIGRLVIAKATVVEFWGLRASPDPASGLSDAAFLRAERYIVERAAAENRSIDADAVERILAHSGTDLGVLRGDVDRVLTYTAGRPEIGAEDVQAVVAGQVSLDDWAIVNAIHAADPATALRELHLMIDGGESPYRILGQLGWYVRAKMPSRWAPRVPAAVRAVFETDLAMKTSGGDPQVLLERLVVELCGGGREERVAPAPRAIPTIHLY